MVTIPARGRVNSDGTLDLHVATGLPEGDVEVLVLLQPTRTNGEKSSAGGAWPPGYFEETFGSLRDNPIAKEPPPPFEARRELL